MVSAQTSKTKGEAINYKSNMFITQQRNSTNQGINSKINLQK